jgi:hypothetical protein
MDKLLEHLRELRELRPRSLYPVTQLTDLKYYLKTETQEQRMLKRLANANRGRPYLERVK